MKTLLVLVSIIMSGTALANSIAQTVSSPLLSSAVSSLGLAEKQAEIVLNDAQEYLLSGTASSFLDQKIKETKSLNSDLSETEALEILLQDAEKILSK